MIADLSPALGRIALKVAELDEEYLLFWKDIEVSGNLFCVVTIRCVFVTPTPTLLRPWLFEVQGLFEAYRLFQTVANVVKKLRIGAVHRIAQQNDDLCGGIGRGYAPGSVFILQIDRRDVAGQSVTCCGIERAVTVDLDSHALRVVRIIWPVCRNGRLLLKSKIAGFLRIRKEHAGMSTEPLVDWSRPRLGGADHKEVRTKFNTIIFHTLNVRPIEPLCSIADGGSRNPVGAQIYPDGLGIADAKSGSENSLNRCKYLGMYF